MDQANDKLLTIREFAKLLGLSLASAYAIIKSDGVPTYRVGARRGAIRVRGSDVTAYIEAGRDQINSKPKAVQSSTVKLRHIRLP